MKTRGFALGLAVALALGATASVYLYVESVRADAVAPPNMVEVIVAKQDVPAGTSIDELIASGGFTTLQVPDDAIVQGSVTDLSQIEGKTTRYPILQGEQISGTRMTESATQVKGGPLGIPQGFKAVTLPLEVPQAVGGVLRDGDHVTIFATFEDISVIPGTLEGILRGKTVGHSQEIGDFTVTLVPDVEVLKADFPVTAPGAIADNNVTAQLTLALNPADAASVVFAQEMGRVWLALLPPNEKGTPQGPVSVGGLLR
jgi:pilus assembly protein CpaB